ncbi:ABC transporter substrate-binding protein [Marinithermus hydrothermalis]|uniref:Extracellular solute-binding protein family 1 n=1 Tax=Marinithermus hydrothermalis (strain DSM 14884 / JCM 11576 / T1) TaxID=869210 RepID=F2NL28_MARHT|nr:extracellular solute-binding protein [Marinithermus hydrothermalis]AEB11431.1 extracellular solute-binding protein family 1 [Marinithermus hydrothermalis DSM 14884]
MRKGFWALLWLLGGLALAQQEIVFWTTEVQPERMAKQEEIVANFEAETGIKVRLVPVEESDLGPRVTAAFSAGDLPDVILTPLSQVIGWADAGILDTEAATEVIERLGRETFAPGALELAAFRGNTAAVPISGWTQLLLYRKDLFEQHGLEPPTTFDRILKAIEVLHNPPEMFGFVAATDVSNDYMMQVLEHFFLANGVELVDEEGNITLDNEKTREVLEFYKKLVEASPEGNLYWQQSRELYLAGRAAMIVWSPFILDELAGLRDAVPVTAFDDPTSPELAKRTGVIGKIAGPSNPEGAGWASVTYLSITVDADTEAAQRWVEYLLSEGYLDWLSFAPEGFFPVRRGTPDDPTRFVEAWADLPVGVDRKAPLSQFYPPEVIQTIVEGLDQGKRWAFSKGRGELIGKLYGTRVMAELVRRYVDGELSLDETVQQLQQRISFLK